MEKNRKAAEAVTAPH